MRATNRRAMTVVVVASLVASACAGGDDATPPEPVVTTTTAAPGDPGAGRHRVDGPAVDGPVTGGARGVPYNPMPPGLAAEYGYVEQEYFLEGVAESYRPVGELTTDGTWTVEGADTAPYRTRVLVRRPAEAGAFNGTVLVEWFNVSAGRDSDPDFGFLHPELARRGYAYVGVSAQRVGIAGGGPALEIPGVPAETLAPLQEWDPERYGDLVHPGDAFSYDIFSDAARALRATGPDGILGDLQVEVVLAAGESQSAGRMVTYVNAVHPVAEVYDGFLVHSRGGGGAPLTDDSDVEMPAALGIRTDLDAPVFQFQTETELVRPGFAAARQPDGATVATWEVAGTAHADASTLAYGTASGRNWYDGPGVDFTELCGRVNEAHQGPVVRAALHHLRAWVVDGDPPPTAPPIELDDETVARDGRGIARGGVRTPDVEVPVAVHTGVGNPSSVFCMLFGQTTPFPADDLVAEYGTHDEYLDRVEAALDDTVTAGYVLDDDRDEFLATARAVAFPD